MANDMLNDLSIVLQWIQEMKRSMACDGANMALARAKAYFSEMEPEAMEGEFPEFSLDVSEFSHEDKHGV